MEELKDLKLTENDFDLLVSGLEFLPNKGQSGELIGSLLESMFYEDKPEIKLKFEKERKDGEVKKQREQKEQNEDIKILQGKLIILKRFLKQEGALKSAYDIINKDDLH